MPIVLDTLIPRCNLAVKKQNIEHFLLRCRRFESQRNQILERRFNNQGIPLSLILILSFAASSFGAPAGNLCNALDKFVRAT